MQFVLFSATPVRLILATGIQNANFDIGRMDLYDNLGCWNYHTKEGIPLPVLYFILCTSDKRMLQ